MGPTFDGGDEVVGVAQGGERYEALFLPDVNNDDLQREGKPAVYYWVPRAVRIAMAGEGGGTPRRKFHLMHFVGVQTGDTHVGVSGTRETAGGVLAVTTTAAPPVAVLESAKQELIKRVRNQQRRFWGLWGNAQPQFAPTPVTSSKVSITNLSPRPDGTVPTETPTSTPTPTSGGTTPAPTGGGPAAPSGGGPPTGGPPRTDRDTRLMPTREQLLRSPRTLPFERDVNVSAIDPWYWDLQGQGPGPMDPGAEHAFSGLIGTLPTAILWQGFKGTYSPISVVQAYLIPVWSSNIRLKIRGDWDRVFQHFSAHATGRNFWFSGDIKAEFNNLRISGGITVELLIDGTAPGADKLEQEITKRIDLITERFMEMAKKRIFEPAPPEVTPAQASSGGGLLGSLFGFGGGFALKYRRDETQLNLSYDETRKFRYNRPHVISSSLEGFFEEIKADPDAERKYFTTLYLDDWDRKVTRIVKPVANFPDRSRHWAGDPVAFLSCQVGYPDTRGAVQWAANVFQSTDTGDTTKWTPAFAKKNASDVVNAPQEWTPDKTFIKRRVHFTEPLSALESPNDRVLVERNIMDIDPGENGTLTNDNTIEVRADSVGVLEVGPMQLGIALENVSQLVEVEFRVPGRTLDGAERPIVKFGWQFNDQETPRRLKIFTGDPQFLPRYDYRVTVTVKGSIFTKGMAWTGPWVEGGGNGPLVVTVPTPEEAVTRRSLLDEEAAVPAPVSTTPALPPPAPVGGGAAVGPPPSMGASRPPRTERDREMVSGYRLSGSQERERERMQPAMAPPGTRRTSREQRAEAEGTGTSAERLELVGGWTTTPPK
jgi:hypothetical protein